MTVSDENEKLNFPSTRETETCEFVITGIFDEPRNLVFRAWTEEQHLKNWFGPRGFTVPICRLNLVPSGAFHYCMRAANGSEMWGKWIFREIAPPDRIVFVNTFSNKHGNLTHHPYVPKWPLEILTTVTFTELEGMTLVQVAWIPIHATAAERRTFDEMREAMNDGWIGTFEQLRTYLGTL